MRDRISKILAVVFGFNVFQFIVILISSDIGYNWVYVIIIVLPLFFVNCYAMLKEKIAYILLLYWYGIQIFNINFEFFSFNFYFGLNFQFMLFDNFGIDPIALLLFIISVFEIDNIFLIKNTKLINE